MSTDELCLWTMPVGDHDMPVTLDGIDAVELAELPAFTADALGWRGVDAIGPDLAAHLRRWATQLHPSTRPPAGGANTRQVHSGHSPNSS